jgi:hypothetical protein
MVTPEPRQAFHQQEDQAVQLPMQAAHQGVMTPADHHPDHLLHPEKQKDADNTALLDGISETG